MSLRLSVVVPMFNEDDVLPLLFARLRPVLDQLGESYEVVMVDDGSTDLTPALLERTRREWPQVRVVRLRMNAGHQNALAAGLASSRGDLVVSLDADLQDPPELIAEMVRVAREQDVDVVYGVRNDRTSDTLFKRWTAGLFYRLIGTLTAGSVNRNSGDFRLMSRQLVDALVALPAPGRVIRFAVPALGFPSGAIEYRREPRAAGRAKYRLRTMVDLSLDSITSVSIAPLRVATYVGLIGGMVGVLVGTATLLAYASGHTLPGWTSTVGIVAVFSTMQLLCLGILGEYIGRSYAFLQNKPTYVIAYDSLVDAPPTPHSPPGCVAATSTEDPKLRS